MLGGLYMPITYICRQVGLAMVTATVLGGLYMPITYICRQVGLAMVTATVHISNAYTGEFGYYRRFVTVF